MEERTLMAIDKSRRFKSRHPMADYYNPRHPPTDSQFFSFIQQPTSARLKIYQSAIKDTQKGPGGVPWRVNEDIIEKWNKKEFATASAQKIQRISMERIQFQYLFPLSSELKEEGIFFEMTLLSVPEASFFVVQKKIEAEMEAKLTLSDKKAIHWKIPYPGGGTAEEQKLWLEVKKNPKLQKDLKINVRLEGFGGKTWEEERIEALKLYKKNAENLLVPPGAFFDLSYEEAIGLILIGTPTSTRSVYPTAWSMRNVWELVEDFQQHGENSMKWSMQKDKETKMMKTFLWLFDEHISEKWET